MSETSVSVLPREVLLKAKFVDDENVDVEYTETFRPEEAALGDRTFKIMKPGAEYVGIKLERVAPETIKPSGVMTSTTLGNMMLTEWLCWSSLGEMKFRDVLLGTFAGATEAAMDYGLERQKEMLDKMTESLRGVQEGLEDALGAELPGEPG